MTCINPYLNFSGNCGQAFDFYKSVFGSEFSQHMRFQDVPPGTPGPKTDPEHIMHVSLPIGKDTVLMGSDRSEAMGKNIPGNNFSISIGTDSQAEADRLFSGLAAGGTVTMPMAKTFWGAYFGMLTDKFGIQWMVDYTAPQPK